MVSAPVNHVWVLSSHLETQDDGWGQVNGVFVDPVEAMLWADEEFLLKNHWHQTDDGFGCNDNNWIRYTVEPWDVIRF